LGSSHRNPKASKAAWSAERRAKQADLMRRNQPWSKSTGPKTKTGKARSAANAKKHGFRSQAFIQRVRDERRLIRDTASTVALAKKLLRLVRLSAENPGKSCVMVWTGNPAVDARPARLKSR
jgi:hypothetical protein